MSSVFSIVDEWIKCGICNEKITKVKWDKDGSKSLISYMHDELGPICKECFDKDNKDE